MNLVNQATALLMLIAGNASSMRVVASPVNLPIDLTVPAPLEPDTDAVVFDESTIFAPNFALNQKDTALSDLFDATGFSALCFPTSLAEDLIYLSTYHAPAFSNLVLNGLSVDKKTIEPNALIRQLAALCQTDKTNGTDSLNAIQCVTSLLAQSGYAVGNTQLISPFNSSGGSTLPIISRGVSIQDMRNALKMGDPILLEVAWFTLDPKTKVWTRANGHYVTAFGYDYNNSWGENQIQLKIVNPEMVYSSDRRYSNFDTITIERYDPQPGIVYPTNRPFIVSGAGFGGTNVRGFLGMMIHVSPGL